MKPKLVFKIIIDILMTAVYLVQMAYMLTDNTAHEIVGIMLFVMFFIHNGLNAAWYKSILKGRYTGIRVFQTSVNILLCITVAAIAVSALMISQTVFASINIGNAALGRTVHSLAAHMGFVLMGVHLGIHWGMLLGVFRKMTKMENESFIRSAVLRVLSIIIAGYGVYAFVSREVWQKITLYSKFPIWRDGDTLAYALIDYFSILVLFTLVTYYLLKFIRKLTKRRD